MNYSDILLLVLAAAPVAYRGWSGWRYGAAFEIRPLLMLFFGVLAAIHYWQPVTEALVGAVTFDPRWVTIGAFLSILLVAAAVAGMVVNVKAQVFQSVQRNYLDNFLGLVAGVLSGGLLGACIVWLATIAVPGKFDSVKEMQTVIEVPQKIFQCLETAVGVAPGSAGRAQYPIATLVEVPVPGGSEGLPEGSILVYKRGKIAWQ